MINDFRNISARPRAIEGLCKGNGPNSCQHLGWGCTQSTLTLHSHTHTHSPRAHRHVRERERERMGAGEKERASGKLLPLLFAHPSVSLFPFFPSLLCSSRRWQRFTVAHFTRLHNFNTVHKLSLLTKLLSSDVGSDGGSTACLQFVGSQNAGQRGQCSRAESARGSSKQE